MAEYLGKTGLKLYDEKIKGYVKGKVADRVAKSDVTSEIVVNPTKVAEASVSASELTFTNSSDNAVSVVAVDADASNDSYCYFGVYNSNGNLVDGTNASSATTGDELFSVLDDKFVEGKRSAALTVPAGGSAKAFASSSIVSIYTYSYDEDAIPDSKAVVDYVSEQLLSVAVDHPTAQADHIQASSDHGRAESDHARAESDHAAVEVYVDSLGAFDISAYNATGGVLAKYADLAAALGTNGVNVPEGIRKGGMSVKFVQGSDNKYVQYRLMADTFSTTVSDWQGVDDEPTAYSENLVKSGGVYEEVSQLEQDISVNGIQKSEYAYSHFTARDTGSASVTLGTDILLTSQGDYIEIKTKAKTNGHILRRPTSSNPPTIRYSAQNTMQVRFNSSTNWTKQDNALDWNEVQILKVYLDSISGTTYNFKMYVNDTLLGTQAVTNPSGWNQIAYGSTTIDMDIYYIETKIGGVVSRLDKFEEMAGANYVTDVYTTVDVPSLSELDERISDLETNVTILEKAVVGEDMYFSFHKISTLSNIQSHFEVCQRIKGNYYLLTVIGYYVYGGSAEYPNGYWRVERTNIGTLIEGEWTTIQKQVLTAGENEFVLRWLAGSNYNFSGGYSGGYHYGETIENVVGAWVEFVADGNRLSTDVDIPLTSCKSFYYREYSPIYQHNDDTIAAWHLKETEFKDGGYETINDVKFVQALDYFAYPGIVCVSRWLSEYAMPEGVATITDMGDGSTTIAEQFKNNGHRIHYEGNGYICDVESEVLIGADDAQCQRVVYNSSAYNKFYRRNPDTEGSVNNRLKGRTKVKIAAM